jgi:RND family efflux transporter MFP subunit
MKTYTGLSGLKLRLLPKSAYAAATVAALEIISVGCARHERPVSPAPAAESSVATVRVTRADLAGSLTLTGEFIPFQEVDVMSKVAGYIRAINVDVGDRVHPGEVLATLEVPEMENDMAHAKAAIDQANAEAAQTEDEVRRTESAHEMTHLSLTRIQNVAKKEPGLVPQQQVDEVRSRDLEAEAQVAAAKSNVAAARQRIQVMQADEDRLKTMRNYETITAPFESVVTKRYANIGAMIQAGTASQTQAMPVVRVSQNNLLRLILPVPESSVAQVSIDRAVSVRVPSLNRTFTGRVARFSDKVQLSTRTMDTEVDVPNPALTLIPGMYAEVDLDLQEHKGVLAAPPDAIDGIGTNTRVFKVDSQGLIHIVPVQIGVETASQVEIREGVGEGDMLVAGRRAGLKEGDRVRPVGAAFLSAERSR